MTIQRGAPPPWEVRGGSTASVTRFFLRNGNLYASTPAGDVPVYNVDPQLLADLAALDEALTELNTVTLPALDADLAAAQSELDAAAADVAAVAAKFPVGSADIQSSAVTTVKLAAGAVTAAKITAGTITATELGSGAVTTTKLAANAVTAAKIAAGTITTTELDAAAINGMTITGAVVQTASSGERIVVRNDGSGGIIESYSGLSGETKGYIDPAAVGSDPSLTLAPGRTTSRYRRPNLRMGASTGAGGTSDYGGSVYLYGDNLHLQATDVTTVSNIGSSLDMSDDVITLDSPEIQLASAEVYNNGSRLYQMRATALTNFTSNGSGDSTWTFPSAFATALVGYSIVECSDPASLGAVIVKGRANTASPGNSDRTKITWRIYDAAGAALTSLTHTVTIVAWGY